MALTPVSAPLPIPGEMSSRVRESIIADQLVPGSPDDAGELKTEGTPDQAKALRMAPRTVALLNPTLPLETRMVWLPSSALFAKSSFPQTSGRKLAKTNRGRMTEWHFHGNPQASFARESIAMRGGSTPSSLLGPTMLSTPPLLMLRAGLSPVLATHNFLGACLCPPLAT